MKTLELQYTMIQFLIIYVTGRKIKYKRFSRGIEQVREEQRRKKSRFCFTKWLRKNTSVTHSAIASGASIDLLAFYHEYRSLIALAMLLTIYSASPPASYSKYARHPCTRIMLKIEDITRWREDMNFMFE